MTRKGIIPLPIIPLLLQMSATDFLTEGNKGNEGRFQMRLKRSARFWSAAALCRFVRPQRRNDEQSGGGPPHSRTLARSSKGPRSIERFCELADGPSARGCFPNSSLAARLQACPV